MQYTGPSVQKTKSAQMAEKETLSYLFLRQPLRHEILLVVKRGPSLHRSCVLCSNRISIPDLPLFHLSQLLLQQLAVLAVTKQTGEDSFFGILEILVPEIGAGLNDGGGGSGRGCWRGDEGLAEGVQLGGVLWGRHRF